MIYIKYLLKLILFSIFFVIPRNKKIWLFRGFADRFIDNSKSLFIYINKEQPKIKAIWITNNQETYNIVKSLGYNCFMMNSIKGLYYSLIGKYHFYGDYNDFITSSGAIAINLWHGTPLKKIEFDIKTGPLEKLFNNRFVSRIKYPHLYRKPDYIISSSKYISNKCFSSAFKIKKEKCLNFGYPRNDVLFNDKDSILNSLKTSDISIFNLMKNKYYKIFIYLPTWRDKQNDFFSESKINLMELDELMETRNSLFLIKMHPATKLDLDISKFTNIKLLNNNVDLYTILPLTDTLITDYSSVFFDYMLLDKNIIFFPFDYEKYTENREFYFDYKDIIPTKPVYTFEELKVKLFKNFNLDSSYKHLKSLFWDYEDGNASKRITDYFFNYKGN